VALAFFVIVAGTGVRAAGLIFPLVVKWSVTLAAPPSFPAAYDDTRAFIALRTGQLTAVSLETGKAEWSVDCPTLVAPAAGDQSVFIGGDRYVEARAQRDGATRWRAELDGKVTALYWNTGWLLAMTDKNALIALRGTDGTVMWRRELTSAPESLPAPDGDRLYLSLKNGAVVALAMQTGEPAWTIQLPQPGDGILAVGDRLYVGSQDNRFYCLSSKDGKVLWSWRTGSDVIGTPVVDSRRVYFVSLDNVLRALDRKSGSLQWSQSLPTRPVTGPLLTGWTVLVAGQSAELNAFSTQASGPTLGAVTLHKADNQETQFAGAPHLTEDTTLILLTTSGQMQALSSAPARYGP
jgi:outer membrane protein assembly factor BamB